MPLTLPEPVTDQLGKSPLKLVVCQIRFEEKPAIAEPDAGLSIFESLGGANGPYPNFSEFRGEQVDITVSPGSSIAAQKTQLAGWRLASEDQNWSVILLPTSVALETKAYASWTNDFEARLRSIIGALVEQVRPQIQMRLGLRYIDLISRPEIASPRDWHEWIEEWLLGPMMNPEIGAAILSAQQQVEIDADNGTRCTLRHGTVLDAANSKPAYLLDWDIHVDAPRAFDQESILGSLFAFNRLALRLFQLAITPKMLDELR